MAGPDSSYSALEIHIDWNVDKDERMEPPKGSKELGKPPRPVFQRGRVD